ncbi:GDSL esterase/lipase [Hibiscus syriacus]|uniref:GDSL esterase/lipase n=1 Tax=Hibiscus syriacus TaxID=106335 RepID=A0A6A3BGM5_HIBSY|nr:GDSL esterase/lipase [Hibiscus syriacus]
MCALFGFGLALALSLSFGVINGEPQVPCFFIFGDSLVDNGNNNRLSSLAKANYMPYGIDFPNGPTGRFSNGKTTVDVISKLLNFHMSELLGFESYIPPYSNARGRQILGGVNYASAAAGIREETGQQLGARISFSGQVRNYRQTVAQVVNLFGGEANASSYLSKCIYSIGLGSNDYLNNYFMPLFYSTSRRFSPEQYADVLIQQYTQQLQFIYIDVYGIFQDITSNPSALGFRVTNAGCCGVGRNNGQITCLPLQRPCRNRNEYLFWDAFHPTEAANVIIGRRSYSAQSLSDAYPIDIHRLAQL